MAEEVTEMESSPNSEIVEDESAESSTAESETEEDLLSVIQDAMQPDEEPESHSEEKVEELDEVAASSETSETDTSVAEDDDENVPFNSHPRFRKLLDERNAFKEKGEKFDVMQNYLTENNLSGDEAAKGLEIMALMKNDPMAALNALKPYVQTLSEAAGIQLPQDIQARVNDGYLDEDAARELSVARAEAKRSNARADAMAESRQRDQQLEYVERLKDTANAWEAKTRESDPDFDLKHDLIDARIRALVNEHGYAKTPDQVLSLANQAYAEVNERFSAKFGNHRPMKTASGGKLGGSPQAEPKSLAEAIGNALGTS